MSGKSSKRRAEKNESFKKKMLSEGAVPEVRKKARRRGRRLFKAGDPDGWGYLPVTAG